jgi:hypothetical protein
MYRLWGSPGETELDVTPFQYLSQYLCPFLFTKKRETTLLIIVMLIIKCVVADVCSNDIGLGAVFATVHYRSTSITVRDYYLILVGKALRPEKSASWAPWEKSSSRWVRLGQRWDSSCSTCTVYSRPH